MDIDKIITAQLRKDEANERANHIPSGKLSASMLNKPLMEQVLKLIGVPAKPFSDYTLRLFKRGKQVEDWLCTMIPGEEQAEVDYRNVVGFIDKMHKGVPIEIKSVKSSQWKWLQKQGPNKGYCLQATLYALGKGTDHSSIILTSADDFRTMQFDIPADDYKAEIDRIIDEVTHQVEVARTLPAFKGREEWQDKFDYADKYSNYPDWVSLEPSLAMQKLQNEYPDAFRKLTDIKKG